MDMAVEDEDGVAATPFGKRPGLAVLVRQGNVGCLMADLDPSSRLGPTHLSDPSLGKG